MDEPRYLVRDPEDVVLGDLPGRRRSRVKHVFRFVEHFPAHDRGMAAHAVEHRLQGVVKVSVYIRRDGQKFIITIEVIAGVGGFRAGHEQVGREQAHGHDHAIGVSGVQRLAHVRNSFQSKTGHGTGCI